MTPTEYKKALVELLKECPGMFTTEQTTGETFYWILQRLVGTEVAP